MSLDDQPEHVRDMAANVAARQRPAPMAYRDGVTEQSAAYWRGQFPKYIEAEHNVEPLEPA